MAKKIFWSHPFQDLADASGLHGSQPRSDDATTTPIMPSTFTFPDGILSEVQAIASYAFSPAVQMASIDMHNSVPNDNAKSFPQPVMSLCYPHEGCHDIIDSVVRSLASKQEADVVVLDPLELALEEFGAFGKGVPVFSSSILIPLTSSSAFQKLRMPLIYYMRRIRILMQAICLPNPLSPLPTTTTHQRAMSRPMRFRKCSMTLSISVKIPMPT